MDTSPAIEKTPAARVGLIRRVILPTLELLVLIAIVAASIGAMSEMGARDSFGAYLARALIDAQQEYVEASARATTLRQGYDEEMARLDEARQQADVTIKGRPLAQELGIETSLKNSLREQAYARQRIATLESAQQFLNRLGMLGVSRKSPDLSFVVDWLEQSLAEISRLEVAGSDVASQGTAPSPYMEWLRTAGDPSNVDLVVREISLERKRSEHLLAIAVVLASVLCGLLAVVRRNRVPRIRTLTIGAATGFIVFLAIKGGRYVFLMQLQGEPIAYNPYSATFVALLAGLFSERAYELLSALVADLENRLQGALKSDSPQRAPESPAEEAGTPPRGVRLAAADIGRRSADP
jgi:hypothetical protein